MRKLILTLFVISILSICVFAVGVVDNAELLTASEEAALEERIEEIRNFYNYDVAILTVTSLDGKDVLTYADEYYDDNGYGIGSDKDGMIFVIGMNEREFATSTCGSGIYFFGDYTLDNIHDNIMSYLSNGEYYKAFDEYLNQVSFVLYSAYEEKDVVSDDYVPVPVINGNYDESIYIYDDEIEKDAGFYVTFEVIAILISLLIGFIVVSIMKSPMKNVGLKKDADAYTGTDDLNLTRRIDNFLYSNVSKTRIETNNNSFRPGSGSSFGGGHSTTRTSSSGTMHGGRSGKF